jgi:hypothetical protein
MRDSRVTHLVSLPRGFISPFLKITLKIQRDIFSPSPFYYIWPPSILRLFLSLLIHCQPHPPPPQVARLLYSARPLRLAALACLSRLANTHGAHIPDAVAAHRAGAAVRRLVAVLCAAASAGDVTAAAQAQASRTNPYGARPAPPGVAGDKAGDEALLSVQVEQLCVPREGI